MVFPRMQSEVFLVWWVVVEGSSRITTSFLALEAASVVTAQEK